MSVVCHVIGVAACQQTVVSAVAVQTVPVKHNRVFTQNAVMHLLQVDVSVPHGLDDFCAFRENIKVFVAPAHFDVFLFRRFFRKDFGDNTVFVDVDFAELHAVKVEIMLFFVGQRQNHGRIGQARSVEVFPFRFDAQSKICSHF